MTTDPTFVMSLSENNNYSVITCRTSIYRYDDGEGSPNRGGVFMLLAYRSVPFQTDATCFFIHLFLLCKLVLNLAVSSYFWLEK